MITKKKLWEFFLWEFFGQEDPNMGKLNENYLIILCRARKGFWHKYRNKVPHMEEICDTKCLCAYMG